MGNWEKDLSFSQRMSEAAERVYKRVFPGCTVEDLRPDGEPGAHVLDQYFAIDKRIILPDGSFYTIQEKYRTHEYLTKYRVDKNTPDFTQEYKNAEGTPHESPGEYFHLVAQLYFYGWSNAAEDDFVRWIILNVAKYKMIIEKSGGIDKIGMKKNNSSHGKASFYAIPMTVLKPAWIFSGGPNQIIEWNTDDTGLPTFN